MKYVMSDIHGNMDRYESVMKQINLKKSDTLYVLGDVIDRQPYGIEILTEIMNMPNVRMLLGNHEYMMMRALGFPFDGIEDIANEKPEDLYDLWYRNGGGVTNLEWNVIPNGLQHDISDYLMSLPLNINMQHKGKKYKLVHAAPVEMYEKYTMSGYDTKTEFAVWNREALIDMENPEDYTIIFGHTPTCHLHDEIMCPLEIWKNGNKIGIDCGSAYTKGFKGGRLACLRIDDMKVFYSEDKL